MIKSSSKLCFCNTFLCLMSSVSYTRFSNLSDPKGWVQQQKFCCQCMSMHAEQVLLSLCVFVKDCQETKTDTNTSRDACSQSPLQKLLSEKYVRAGCRVNKVITFWKKNSITLHCLKFIYVNDAKSVTAVEIQLLFSVMISSWNHPACCHKER